MAPIATLTNGDRALLCSDVHLYSAEPQLAEHFLAQLKLHSAGISHLFILGDLFEAWVGDDPTDVISLRTLELLNEIAVAGIAVFIMRGNRDFLIGENQVQHLPGFNWSEHLQLIDDPSLVRFWGEPTLLAHGDTFCTDDTAYQAFRLQRNTPSWRKDFMSRPLAARVAIARQMRLQSRHAKAAKSQYLMDVNQPAVEAAMQSAGVQTLIHGHTHRPARHQWLLEGHAMQRWVLPDWQLSPRRGGFLLISGASDKPVYAKLGTWI